MIRRVIPAAFAALLVLSCQGDRNPASPNSAWPRFVVDATAPVLVGAGDIGNCGEYDTATAKLLDTIPGTVYTLGDNAYPDGADSDYVRCYDPTWGRQKSRTRPAVGNHEYNTPGAAGYWHYFGAAAGDSGKFYYSYNVASWHVIVLNSSIDISATSPQIQWLKSDLAGSNARCTIAMWHQPRWSSGTVHGSDPTFQAAWQALYDGGADVVIAGHEHNYERFAAQNPAGGADPSYGIREFVAGTGSDASDPFGAPIANSEVRSNTPGVLRFTLDTNGYSWKFVPISTRTFTDAGSDVCHGVPVNQPPSANAGGPYSTADGTVHFNGAGSSDPNGDLLTYQWDFGDGNTNDGSHPSHTYLADGTFAVRLTVSDGKGGQSSATTTASVNRTNTSIVFAGAANVAACTYGQAEATARILDTLPGFVFAAGDNAFPNGTLANYQNCYQPRWGRDKTRTLPVMGNHEYDSSTTAAGAFGYWGSRAGTAGQHYYSTDLGAWHVVVLDDNVAMNAGSAQEQWLKADLAATSQRCIMALWHVPLFISSSTAGYYTNPGRKPLWDDLYAAHADLVVNGHQHDYERMAPMRPDGTRDDSTGIRQINPGGGGESVGMPTVIHPNSVALAAAFGVLKLTLKSGGYDWQFIPIPGQTFTDAGSATCHNAPPPPPPNQAPTANAGGPYRAEATVQFDGTGSSDPDGNTPLGYAWDFGDGTTGTGATPTHTYAAFGTYTVTLTVTDSKGLAGAPARTTATLANVPPSVSAGSNSSMKVGTYTLNGSFTDPGNDGPFHWTIEWGDMLGSTTSGTQASQGAITASHSYLLPGTYTVRLTVTDANGGSGSATVVVTVTIL